MSRARALRRITPLGPGASMDTLYKRLAYRNRKGRVAARRVFEIVKLSKRIARIFGP